MKEINYRCMKTLFAIMLGVCWVSTASVYAHEEVQDTPPSPTIKENTACLHKIQQTAANCTGMYFYIGDIEEDAEYVYRLSAAARGWETRGCQVLRGHWDHRARWEN